LTNKLDSLSAGNYVISRADLLRKANSVKRKNGNDLEEKNGASRSASLFRLANGNRRSLQPEH